MNTKNTTVASLVWNMSSQLHRLQGEVVEQLGYPHRFFFFDDPIPPGAAIILIQGPYGTLLPLVRRLIDYSPERRPVLAYWFQQSLDMVPPEWIRGFFAGLFSDLHRHYPEAKWNGFGMDRALPNFISTKGARLGFLGDILWLHRHSFLDVLALSSTLYAQYLESFGINSLVLPRGYHADYGEVLALTRDIAVVWMGKLRNRHRRRAVHWLRKELEKRGQVMHVYDGQEKDFIFGDRRTQILNRTWFVLNVYPHPTWELSIRYYISAANGAVVLTEPGKNKYSFVPGKHLVECPIKEMPDTIMYYLAHEEEWRAISAEMLRIMRRELTLEQSVASILARAEKVLDERN